MLTTLGELIGAALIACGCFLLAPWLGLVVAGVLMIGLSYLAAP